VGKPWVKGEVYVTHSAAQQWHPRIDGEGARWRRCHW
jgi:hypothetical protein